MAFDKLLSICSFSSVCTATLMYLTIIASFSRYLAESYSFMISPKPSFFALSA